MKTFVESVETKDVVLLSKSGQRFATIGLYELSLLVASLEVSSKEEGKEKWDSQEDKHCERSPTRFKGMICLKT